ncbi:MAG: glycerate kinase [Vicinamibacterales bacterium]
MIQAALDGVSARRVVERALERDATRSRLLDAPVHLLAVGKAGPAMATALLSHPEVRVRSALAIGTHPASAMPASLDFMPASHPFPDHRSRAAAAEALARASRVARDERLVLMLSGGASALMCEAAEGLAFDDKLSATRALMLAGADIHQLNALRKHLSRVKGGRLAAACPGATTTLALSDVVGDDLSVIGSGPGVPDPSTWADVAAAIEACDAWGQLPQSVVSRIREGVAGTVAETPKAGDVALSRADAFVVGRAADAVDAARAAAAQLGYAAIVLDERVTGEARVAGPAWLDRSLALARAHRGRVCVLSAGETVVQVTGPGIGGRNLEFALSLAEPMAGMGAAIAATAGTDGIDGVSDVAGATVDGDTLHRARARGLPTPGDVLDRNDSFNFFAPLGDTIRTGRTDTNVGDIQVLLVNP